MKTKRFVKMVPLSAVEVGCHMNDIWRRNADEFMGDPPDSWQISRADWYRSDADPSMMFAITEMVSPPSHGYCTAVPFAVTRSHDRFGFEVSPSFEPLTYENVKAMFVPDETGGYLCPFTEEDLIAATYTGPPEPED